MTEYKRCEECGAVLVKDLKTGSVHCIQCGWSPNEESEVERPEYIG